MSEELRKDKRARQAEGQRKNYRQGQQITFVLGGENEVNEHQTEGENKRSGVALLVFRTRQTREIVAKTCGQRLCCHLFDCFDNLARRISVGRCYVDVDAGEEVETPHVRRAIHTCKCAILAYGHHALCSAHVDVGDVAWFHPTGNIALNHYAIQLTKAVEVGCVHTAIVALQR